MQSLLFVDRLKNISLCKDMELQLYSTVYEMSKHCKVKTDTRTGKLVLDMTEAKEFKFPSTETISPLA